MYLPLLTISISLYNDLIGLIGMAKTLLSSIIIFRNDFFFVAQFSLFGVSAESLEPVALLETDSSYSL